MGRELLTKLEAGSVSGELVECSFSSGTSAPGLERNHWHLAYNEAEMEAEGGAATSISACRLIDRRDEKDLGQVTWVRSLLWVCYHHFRDRPMSLKEICQSHWEEHFT